MGRIIESTFVTLDGVIDEPHVWGQPYWDDEHAAYAEKLTSQVDGLLLGGATFGPMSEAWMSRAGDPGADAFNAMPKHVVTRRELEPSWNATIHAGEDAADVVRDLRAGDGTWLKYGSGELSRQLLEAGLVDEYHLWMFPCLAGGGTRLFDGAAALTHLQLVDTTRFASGIVVHTLTPKA